MNLEGKRYGQWLVIEDKQERVGNSVGITCQCDCGTIKKLMKSPFLHGYNSSKCAPCNKKRSRICTSRK
jgi:hypothetical protein